MDWIFYICSKICIYWFYFLYYLFQIWKNRNIKLKIRFFKKHFKMFFPNFEIFLKVTFPIFFALRKKRSHLFWDHVLKSELYQRILPFHFHEIVQKVITNRHSNNEFMKEIRNMFWTFQAQCAGYSMLPGTLYCASDTQCRAAHKLQLSVFLLIIVLRLPLQPWELTSHNPEFFYPHHEI